METNRYFNLRVDSKNRASGTSDNWITQLPQPIQTSPDAVCMLMQAIFPVSWYTISAGSNDTLFVSLTNGQTDIIWYGIYQITIPEGAYDIDQLCALLPSLLINATVADFQNPLWTVRPTTDGRISITFGDPEITSNILFRICSREDILDTSWTNNNEGFETTIPPQIAQYQDRLANHTLGFYGSNLINPGQGEALIAHGLFNALGTQYVCIHSSMQQLGSQGPGKGDNDVIGIIPVMSGFGTLNVYQCSGSDIEVFSVSNMTLQTLNFYLTNDSGQRLDLRGGTVVLSFMIYDKP